MWEKVASPYTAQHCGCEAVMGNNAIVSSCSRSIFSLPSFCLALTPPVIANMLGKGIPIQEICIIITSSFYKVLLYCCFLILLLISISLPFSCHPCLLLCSRLQSALLWQVAVCPMHALCPLPSTLCALCLMSPALCGPVGFYLLFVSDICFVFVAWFEHVLLPSCVFCCCHVLHSGN